MNQRGYRVAKNELSWQRGNGVFAKTLLLMTWLGGSVDDTISEETL